MEDERNSVISLADLKNEKKSTVTKKIEITGTVKNWVLYHSFDEHSFGQANLFRSHKKSFKISN